MDRTIDELNDDGAVTEDNYVESFAIPSDDAYRLYSCCELSQREIKNVASIVSR